MGFNLEPETKGGRARKYIWHETQITYPPLMAVNKSLELLTWVQKYKVDSKLISDYYPQQGQVLVQIILVSQ